MIKKKTTNKIGMILGAVALVSCIASMNPITLLYFPGYAFILTAGVIPFIIFVLLGLYGVIDISDKNEKEEEKS
ncbi:MAG TPA: hypothetical protein VMV77_03850 [Bacteroidales bacterium]|nr:hypothetical protein [Bacteroidales bacterium]